MPETSSRRERGLRNGSGPFGHGRPASSSLPRRTTSDLPQQAASLPALDSAFWDVVDDGLARASLELSTGARAALDAQARLLIAWSGAINLTALRTPAQIARGHVLDSLLALPLLRSAAPRDVLDLGSGAGYPGLPLAVALPVARAALVDSIGKKAAFLAVVARVAEEALRGAGIIPPVLEALAERAEDLADEPEQRESWDLVVARAVGTVAEVAELALPLVRRGGRVAIWKRDGGDGQLEREIGAAGRLCRAAGGSSPRLERLPAAEALGLPGHCLVVVAKARPTPGRFPRPAGERRRSPLLP